jgi:O-6-methylguanine DNA methyltransferase
MKKLFSTQIATPIGKMIAISDENALYLLDFTDTTLSKKKIDQILTQNRAIITTGSVFPLISIKEEIEAYFARELKLFTTPIIKVGSEFQQLVWEALKNIPYGEVLSYLNLAKEINRPNAHRAAANANGANRFTILVPCHRVISNNGSLGGYSGGVKRKEFLLDLEHQNS